VRRVGVEVLRFDPSAPGSKLSQIAIVETPGATGGVHIREHNGTRTLLVADNIAGIRVYGYPSP